MERTWFSGSCAAVLLSTSLAWAATPDPAAIAAHGPLGWWRFGETAPGPAADSSGGGHDGVYLGGVDHLEPGTTSDGDDAMGVNGSDAFMEVSGLPLGRSFTVLVWARSDTPTWNAHGWIASARVPNGFILHADEATRGVSMYLLDHSGNYHQIGTVQVDDITEWHQYGIRYNADRQLAAMILDGQVLGESGYGRSSRADSREVTIWFGQDMCCFPRFGLGAIDEAAIYTRSLSRNEIGVQAGVASPCNDADADDQCDAADPCPHDPVDDSDDDGICGDADTCPTRWNPDQDPTACMFQVPAPDGILAAGPVGYWRFSEGGGTTSVDASGHGRDGTYHGSVDLTAEGMIAGDTALGLDGGDGFMEVQGVPLGESFTVLVWARSDTEYWNSHGWLASARVANGFILHADQDTLSTSMYILDRWGNYHHVGTVTVDSILEWHQYGLMYDAPSSTVSMIVDGEVVGDAWLSSGARGAATPVTVWFGQDMCCYPRFGDGALDEGVIYDRALTLAELAATRAVPAGCSDGDGDGLCDGDDACPTVNPDGADVDGDGCIDAPAALADFIAEQGLPPSVTGSLGASADNAAKAAASGNTGAAANMLSALINKVKAQRGKSIPAGVADALIAFAENAIDAL